MKKLLLILSLFFSIFLVYALTGNTNYTYDNFDDGIINYSLWQNVSVSGAHSITETGGYLQVYSVAPTGHAEIISNSSALPSVSLIKNLSLESYLFGDRGAGIAADGRAILTVFGVQINITDCCDNQVIRSKYNFLRKSNGDFDVYDDGVFSKTITPINNQILLFTNTNAVSSEAISRLYYVEYTTIDSTLNTTLSSPSNNSLHITSNITFNANFTLIPTDFVHNFTNATINIWRSNGTLFNKTTNIVLGNSSNSTTWNISSFNIGDYKWNVYACGLSGSNVLCSWGQNNFTFKWGLNQNAVTFNASTIETSLEAFKLNITLPSSVSLISARLFYNNTYYPSTKTTSGLNTLFDNILSIPSTTSQVNKTFFWELNLDGTLFNTTNNNQIVNTLNLGVCSGSTNVRVFNFTSALETNLTRVNPYSFEGTFDYFIGDGSTVKSVSISNTSIAEVSLCVSDISKNINLDAEISYGFEGVNLSLVSRKYFFQDAVITNSTQNITLLLLDSEDATTFILKVLDNSVQPVADALISILRYYPGEGIFRTVQIAKTDSTGQTVGFYEAETVTYKHIITKNGVVLLDTGQGGIVVGQSIPFTLTFTVGDSLVASWTYLNANSTILTSLSYNKTSELVTFSYIDPTGSANLGRLHVYQDSLSNNTVTTICDTPTTGSSATINCNMSGQSGTFVAKGYVTTSTNLQKVISFILETARAIFDKTGAFMGWLILITVAMSVLWNPSVGVVLINVAIIFLGVIGLLVFSPIAYFSLIGISIILLILFRT